MQRDFKEVLLWWKDHPQRLPLIVRGARQVGKSFLIEAFGREEFKETVVVNFEQSGFSQVFDSKDPGIILRELELIMDRVIVPGDTLLFLDEIQQCPQALAALRFFKEKVPQLHVIAAGSLLEFAIHDEHFSFPVGRVQFARLYPLSFGEFLEACGEGKLRAALHGFTLLSPPSAAVHAHLLSKMREYFVVGGMPAAVVAFVKTGSFLESKYVQKSLWEAFEGDFGKYASQTQHRHLKKIFKQAPQLVGSHVKYNRIDPDLLNPARDMKSAIELLRLAGLVHRVNATSAGDVPLLVGIKEQTFKLLFLDIGLLEPVMDVDPEHPGLLAGPLAEQFVGQELLALSDPRLETSLFFWMRDKHGSSAEVDYLLVHKGKVLPIEVKAGKTGKLKSLHAFMKEKASPLGIKISIEPLTFSEGILSVPFYLLSELMRLLLAHGVKLA